MIWYIIYSVSYLGGIKEVHRMEFIKDFTRKVTDTAKVAAKKSSDMVEITKLNFNIGSEEDKIKKTYTQIGEIVYHSYEKGEEIPQDLKELCEKVVATKKSIEKMRQQILSLKNIKICPTCKEELPEEVAFCPKCGTKQEVVVPVVQEEKAEDNVLLFGPKILEFLRPELRELIEPERLDQLTQIYEELKNRQE